MRYSIFGDVHSNLEALEAVLEDAYYHNCDAWACTGDIVGYGPNPRECVKLIHSLDCPVVKGDLDDTCTNENELSDMLNPLARNSLQWHRKNIDAEARQYLRNLPLTASIDSGDWGIVHATLDDPGGYVYMTNSYDIMAHFAHQLWNISFCGHTHIPRMWQYDSDSRPQVIDAESIVVVGTHQIYAFNVGSVGQSRDGDWRASYMIFDTVERTVEPRRVEYDRELYRLKIRQSGLIPSDLGLE